MLQPASDCWRAKLLNRFAFYSAGDVATLLNHARRVAGRSRQVTGVSGPNSRCGCAKRDWGKVNRVQHRCTRGETGRGSSRLSCCRDGVTSRHVSVEPRARARRRSRPLALFVYQLYVTSVFSKGSRIMEQARNVRRNSPLEIITEVSVVTETLNR